MGHRPVDEIGEDFLDDRVPTVGHICLGHRLSAVGEEGVVTPNREQLLKLRLVPDPAHDQAGGDRVLGGGERSELGFGDLGIGDQLPGVRVEDGTRVVHVNPDR